MYTACGGLDSVPLTYYSKNLLLLMYFQTT